MNFLLRQIKSLADVLSKPLRDNFSDITSWFLYTNNRIDISLTPPAGSEVTDARDFFPLLEARLMNGFQAIQNRVITGLVVQAQTIPNATVKISAGDAQIAGVGVHKTATSNTGSITFPTNYRYDVVYINAGNAIAVATGNDSVDPILPAISDTQRALAILVLYPGQTTIQDADIIACQTQGCTYQGKFYWKIQDAVSALGAIANSLAKGEIFIADGQYYEEVNLTGFSDVTLNYQGGAKHYRPSSTQLCLKAINTNVTIQSLLKIKNGSFYGNGKTGAFANLQFDYCDDLLISDCFIDPNSSSTADRKTILRTNVRRDLISPDDLIDNIRRAG